MLTRGLSSLVVLAAMASIVISFAAASPVEGQDESSTSTSTTTVKPSNTYFGIDANDKEAVAEKQRELSHEKWRQMMGDVDINGIDFSPEIGSPFDFIKNILGQQGGSEHVEAFGKTIKSIAAKIGQALTEGPHAEEIRKHLGELLKLSSKIGEQPALQAVFKKFQELMSRKE